MMKKVRWIPPVLAALFLVPWAWAASQVVGVDGSVYSVGVVEMEAEASPGATALTYSVLRPSGRLETGFVSPTEDLLSDREPSLVLPPGEGGPFLIWTRSDGAHDQVAYSRYTGTLWTEIQYLTSGSRDHLHPQVGVDSQGTAYVVWVEPEDGGSVLVATFDPRTGNLFAGPRDLLRELARRSAPEWLGREQDPLKAGGRFPDFTIEPVPEGGNDTPAIPPGSLDSTKNDSSAPVPEGGNDTPAIPPGSENSSKKDSAKVHLTGGVSLDATCHLAVAAVVRNRVIHIGVLENGVALKHYKSVIPAHAPAEYASMLQQALLDLHCQP